MGGSSITVGISGCGAVAALYYAPALQLLETERTLRVIGLFDPDPRELAAVGARFPSAARHASFDALLADRPDLVIVASPPAHHAEQAADALRVGCGVLCEKPLATRLCDARALVNLARESGRILAAGMIRRYLPATRFNAPAVQRLRGRAVRLACAVASLLHTRLLGRRRADRHRCPRPRPFRLVVRPLHRPFLRG